MMYVCASLYGNEGEKRDSENTESELIGTF